MSLHYLLDGYNIIHQIAGEIPTKLEDQRLFLVQLIKNKRLQGSLNNKVTIVFDGQAGIGAGEFYGPSEQSASSAINIIFSKDETADDKIKKLVTQSTNKKNMIVVTNDRDIQYSVRALGAQVKSVQNFLEQKKFTAHAKKASVKDGNASEIKNIKNISKTLEFRITSEFKKIWLKE